MAVTQIGQEWTCVQTCMPNASVLAIEVAPTFERYSLSAPFRANRIVIESDPSGFRTVRTIAFPLQRRDDGGVGSGRVVVASILVQAGEYVFCVKRRSRRST